MNSDFDLDFSYGYSGEQLVEALLTNGKTVEVKRDRRWKDTNNLYVETKCWYVKSQSWEASGLLVSKAEYWAFVLETGVLMIPIANVYDAVKTNGRHLRCNIEPNRSEGYLITVDDLMTSMKTLN